VSEGDIADMCAWDRLIIGGGVSDIEGTPRGGHGHWDKHGEWREGDWFGSTRGVVGNEDVGGVREMVIYE
jgi:hypothetical protein